ncbi:unnamed protein product [Owenia fusiformis]|uniref:PDZ domain-containing protein n=1 Tax=Owenia fusiformis TaxID=6347 RepID=A0A8S4PE73_OWEFU|nr:unnamed protein product [Owenia fusiformis]
MPQCTLERLSIHNSNLMTNMVFKPLRNSRKKGTVKVYATIVSSKFEAEKYDITNETTAKDLIGQILLENGMTSRDRNLYYMTLNLSSNGGGKVETIADDELPISILQKMQMDTSFILKMKNGELVKIHDTCLHPHSFSKNLFVSGKTTSHEVIALLLQGYRSNEDADLFMLQGVDQTGKVLCDLKPSECPVLVQRQVTPDCDVTFHLKRRLVRRARPIKRSKSLASIRDLSEEKRHNLTQLRKKYQEKQKGLNGSDTMLRSSKSHQSLADTERDRAISKIRFNLLKLQNDESSVFYRSRQRGFNKDTTTEEASTTKRERVKPGSGRVKDSPRKLKARFHLSTDDEENEATSASDQDTSRSMSNLNDQGILFDAPDNAPSMESPRKSQSAWDVSSATSRKKETAPSTDISQSQQDIHQKQSPRKTNKDTELSDKDKDRQGYKDKVDDKLNIKPSATTNLKQSLSFERPSQSSIDIFNNMPYPKGTTLSKKQSTLTKKSPREKDIDSEHINIQSSAAHSNDNKETNGDSVTSRLKAHINESRRRSKSESRLKSREKSKDTEISPRLQAQKSKASDNTRKDSRSKSKTLPSVPKDENVQLSILSTKTSTVNSYEVGHAEKASSLEDTPNSNKQSSTESSRRGSTSHKGSRSRRSLPKIPSQTNPYVQTTNSASSNSKKQFLIQKLLESKHKEIVDNAKPYSHNHVDNTKKTMSGKIKTIDNNIAKIQTDDLEDLTVKPAISKATIILQNNIRTKHFEENETLSDKENLPQTMKNNTVEKLDNDETVEINKKYNDPLKPSTDDEIPKDNTNQGHDDLDDLKCIDNISNKAENANLLDEHNKQSNISIDQPVLEDTRDNKDNDPNVPTVIQNNINISDKTLEPIEVGGQIDANENNQTCDNEKYYDLTLDTFKSDTLSSVRFNDTMDTSTPAIVDQNVDAATAETTADDITSDLNDIKQPEQSTAEHNDITADLSNVIVDESDDSSKVNQMDICNTEVGVVKTDGISTYITEGPVENIKTDVEKPAKSFDGFSVVDNNCKTNKDIVHNVIDSALETKAQTVKDNTDINVIHKKEETIVPKVEDESKLAMQEEVDIVVEELNPAIKENSVEHIHKSTSKDTNITRVEMPNIQQRGKPKDNTKFKPKSDLNELLSEIKSNLNQTEEKVQKRISPVVKNMYNFLDVKISNKPACAATLTPSPPQLISPYFSADVSLDNSIDFTGNRVSALKPVVDHKLGTESKPKEQKDKNDIKSNQAEIKEKIVKQKNKHSSNCKPKDIVEHKSATQQIATNTNSQASVNTLGFRELQKNCGIEVIIPECSDDEHRSPSPVYVKAIRPSNLPTNLDNDIYTKNLPEEYCEGPEYIQSNANNDLNSENFLKPSRPSLFTIMRCSDIIPVVLKPNPGSDQDFGIKLFESVFTDELMKYSSGCKSFHVPSGRKPVIGHRGSPFAPVTSPSSHLYQSMLTVDVVIPGSIAHTSGMVREGDHILEVNGSYVLEWEVETVQSVIDISKDVLHLVVARSKSPYQPISPLNMHNNKGDMYYLMDQSSSHTDAEKQLAQLTHKYQHIKVETQRKDEIITELQNVIVRKEKVKQIAGDLRYNGTQGDELVSAV